MSNKTPVTFIDKKYSTKMDQYKTNFVFSINDDSIEYYNNLLKDSSLNLVFQYNSLSKDKRQKFAKDHNPCVLNPLANVFQYPISSDFTFVANKNSETFFDITVHRNWYDNQKVVKLQETPDSTISIDAPVKNVSINESAKHWKIKSDGKLSSNVSISDNAIETFSFDNQQAVHLYRFDSNSLKEITLKNIDTVGIDMRDMFAPSLTTIKLENVRKFNLGIPDHIENLLGIQDSYQFNHSSYSPAEEFTRVYKNLISKNWNKNCKFILDKNCIIYNYAILPEKEQNSESSRSRHEWTVSELFPDARTNPVEVTYLDILKAMYKFKQEQYVKKIQDLTTALEELSNETPTPQQIQHSK